MVDRIELAHLTGNIIEELVDSWVSIDPHSKFIFLSQKATIYINICFSKSFEDSFMTVQKNLHHV